MSAEYAARMETLQRKREELTAQRQAIEKRLALREATAAEFSAVALQSCKQKWKAQRTTALAAKKRNEEFVRTLHETQRQVHDTWVRLRSDQSSSSALLEQEKARYNRRIEQVYPAWQEQLQRQRVLKLRELEEKKRAVERRRYLAKQSFEKEQTLDDLIRKTRHEVEMAENLEQNELYEREILRTQSTNQAKEVDQTIRDVALDARSYLQQQAATHLVVTPEFDEELGEKLSETFSPRKTLHALQEANSSLTFEENQFYEEEEKPARQIRVEIPVRMRTPTRAYYQRDNQRGPTQEYVSDYDDQIYDVQGEVDQIPEQYNVNPRERCQVETGMDVENDYITFKNAAEIVQSSRSKPQASTGSLPQTSQGPLTKLPSSSYSRKQIGITSIESGAMTQEIQESRSACKQLPTLVSERLDPIPEAIEFFSPDKSGVRVAEPGFSIHNPSITDQRGPAGQVINSDAATSASLVSTPSAPVNLPPVKVEENRVANSFVTEVATSLNNTSLTGIEANFSGTEHNDITKASVGDAVIQKSSTCSATETNEAVSSTRDTAQDAAVFSADLSQQLPRDDIGKTFSSSSFLLEERHHVDKVTDDGPPLTPVEEKISPDISNSSDTSNTLIEEKPPEAASLLHQVLGVGEFVEDKPDSQVPLNTPNIGDDEPKPLSTANDESKSDAVEGERILTVDATEVPSTSSFASDIAQDTDDQSKTSSNTKISAVEYQTSSVKLSDIGIPETLSSEAASVDPSIQSTEEDMLLTSMQSDDFESSANDFQQITGTKPIVPNTSTTDTSNANTDADESYTAKSPDSAAEETISQSVTDKLSSIDRAKALGALISRVEEGAAEGDTLGGSSDTGSSYESKRELIKMAVSGLKAQVAFFGSDICFELVLDISRDLGPVLFPPKAFEGIMNDQKVRKLHQSNKQKELDLWKALSTHMKQLVQLKAISSASLVDLFVAAFLAHDPDNQRSKRKLREFLVMLCGGKSSSPRKESSTTSQPPSPAKQEQHSPSPEPAKPLEPKGRIEIPGLLQTAFLPRPSPPKPKAFGLASSGFKDRSNDSSDVLKSMSSGPMKLSQKLMRGGKMNDYSEFEEEDEVDLQNLIGTKPTFAARSSALGRSPAPSKTSPSKPSAKQDVLAEDDDEFDADF